MSKLQNFGTALAGTVSAVEIKMVFSLPVTSMVQKIKELSSNKQE